MMLHKNFGSAALVLATLLAPFAYAAPTTFFGENSAPSPAGTVTGDPVSARNSFVAQLNSGVQTQDFESFSVGTPAGAFGMALSFTGTGGAIGATLFGDGKISNDMAFGRFNTTPTPGGSKWYDTSDNFSVSFNKSISAFGFYATDVGDFGGQLSLTLCTSLTDNSTCTTDIAVGNQTRSLGNGDGSLLFFGFVDQTASYSRIFFNTAYPISAPIDSIDYFGFDGMVVGDSGQVNACSPNCSTAPEPTSLALTGLALAAAGFAARRTRPA